MIYNHLGDRNKNATLCCSRHVVLPYSEAYSRLSCQVRYIPHSRTLARTYLEPREASLQPHTLFLCSLLSLLRRPLGLLFLKYIISVRCCHQILYEFVARPMVSTRSVNRFHFYLSIKTTCWWLKIMTFLLMSLTQAFSYVAWLVLDTEFSNKGCFADT